MIQSIWSRKILTIWTVPCHPHLPPAKYLQELKTDYHLVLKVYKRRANGKEIDNSELIMLEERKIQLLESE